MSFGVASYAHHSFSYHFDANKKITIEGTIKEYRFINPHSHLLVDVVNENGELELWDCELPPANVLRRAGWNKDVLPQGASITITGSTHKRVNTECAFDFGIFSDGTRITSRQSFVMEEKENNSINNIAPALDSNIPNINGVWRMLRTNFEPNGIGYGGMGVPGPDDPNPWIDDLFSEKGIEALNEYDPILDDPALRCSPVSISRLWRNGQPLEIKQEEKTISIFYEWMDAERVINLEDDRTNLGHRMLGHSVGSYSGHSITINTSLYKEGVIHQHPGLPHSNDLTSIEVISLDPDTDILHIKWQLNDPIYWVKSFSETRSFERIEEPLQAYNCQH